MFGPSIARACRHPKADQLKERNEGFRVLDSMAGGGSPTDHADAFAFRGEAFDFALKVVRDYRAELMMDVLPDL